ncbi:hypothetical protein BH10BAC6_BH10BAC6_09170 [soil metagenome]
MLIMKFGGSVLRDEQGFRRMTSILGSTSGEPVLVVVSAFSTVTRDLDAMSALAASGHLQGALTGLEQLQGDLAALCPSPASWPEDLAQTLQQCFEEMQTLLRAMSVTRQRTARIRDRFLAYGEFLSLHVSHAHLAAAAIPATRLDVRTVLITDDTFGSAAPHIEKTRVHVEHDLLPLFNTHSIVITQGFVGCTEHGDTTTMGKESSNLTASFLGSLLKAREIVIWTDVEGVRSADPTVCNNTVVRSHLTYAQARIAAHHGVKLLYPTMIEPAERENIPIRIAHAEHPNGGHTIIANDVGETGPLITLDGETITTLFAPRSAWLHAADAIVAALHLDDQFSVSAGSETHVATMTVPLAQAHVATQLFHDHIIERP